jgi:aspartate aminotransferase
MPELAASILSVKESGVRTIFEVALTLDDVIMLAVGEPDVPVAPHISAAAKAAWDADETNYTANGGIPILRAAIAAKLAAENNVHVDTERVWVTVGATQALHQAMALTLAAGDEVLLPDPGYTTFTMNARMLDATPVPYSLLPQHEFLPDFEQLEALVSDKTKVIIVNSPSNPLGVVFPRETLEKILDFAKKHDLWVISDEVYEAFHYGAEHVSIASLDEENRVFSAFSLSKTYAMTGVRVGYLVTPPGLSATMRSVQEASISCVAAPDQYAAVAAITGDQSAVADAARHYRANFETAAAVLEARGIRYHFPQGSFYLWVDVAYAAKGDVTTWARDFLLAQRVAVAPGTAFGRSGEGWIRVCLAASEADLVEGLGRLPQPLGG